MAIIVPYGDPNAHGSIGDVVTFRRRYGKVIFQKKPFPKQPNSAGQIAQRNAFKNALSGWYALNQFHKDFYNIHGPELGMTGLNLYIQQALLGNLPSTTSLQIRRIVDCNIITVRAAQPNGILWLFRNDPFTLNWWTHWDNANTKLASYYTGSQYIATLVLQQNTSPYPIYSFRDGVWIQFHTAIATNLEMLIRIPESDMTTGTKIFWIADDGSVYFDSAMQNLACVSKF